MTPEDWSKVGSVAGPAGAIGICLAALSNAIQRKRTVSDWVTGCIAGGLAGAAMALAVHDSGWPVALQGLLIGVAACNAGDLLEGMRLIFSLIRNDPLQFLERFWRALRGGGSDK